MHIGNDVNAKSLELGKKYNTDAEKAVVTISYVVANIAHIIKGKSSNENNTGHGCP